ncbi:MAG: thioesterase family protein [Methylobacteriaceae bacterium]|nr:thioesterase family protein [Methylobacteriaceae bacterium]
MIEAPLPLIETPVVADWIDFNGHMNDAAYALVFSRAVDRFVDRIGLDESVRKATRLTIYTLQLMIHYFKEAKIGDMLAVTGHLLEHDAKRFRIFARMSLGSTGPLLATSEQVLICVDQSGETPKSSPFPSRTGAALEAILTVHARLPLPPEAGRGVALRPR